MAISSPGIAIGGIFVFAHHMFAAGIPAVLRVPFMVTTLLVAVPTGVKMFAWVATMWMGRIRITTPFLFVLSAIIVFLIGGLTGIPLGVVPTDLYLHDTYFVVGHFHAMLFGGFLLPAMAAVYYWYPKVTGRMLSDRLGRWQWLAMTLGVVVLVIPLLGLGLLGQRRRVADYALGLGMQPLHIITAVGGLLVFAGVVIMVVNIVRSFKQGELAGNNPWGARALEWQTSSPPPENNFAEIPEVVGEPDVYGVPGATYAVVPPGTREGGSVRTSGLRRKLMIGFGVFGGLVAIKVVEYFVGTRITAEDGLTWSCWPSPARFPSSISSCTSTTWANRRTVKMSSQTKEASSRPAINRLGLWLFFLSESFLFGALLDDAVLSPGGEPAGRPQPDARLRHLLRPYPEQPHSLPGGGGGCQWR